MKRTSLKPSAPPRRSKPLKRGPAPKRTGRLKPRSERTQRVYTEQRIPLVIRILEERPECEACPVWNAYDGVDRTPNRSVDCHEKLTRGRSGGVFGTAWLDPDNILAVCRPCHTRIGDNPKISDELGLTVPSYSGRLKADDR